MRYFALAAALLVVFFAHEVVTCVVKSRLVQICVHMGITLCALVVGRIVWARTTPPPLTTFTAHELSNSLLAIELALTLENADEHLDAALVEVEHIRFNLRRAAHQTPER